MQDSVAIRTIMEMLSRQEKMGRDTNLKKQLSIIVVTKKTLSRLKSNEEEHGNLGHDTNLQKLH